MSTTTKTMKSNSPTSSEILRRFAQIVANSLRIESSEVHPEDYLDELGAESLDLIEISMETETQFNIWLPEKSILETATEVFGHGVLEQNGYLTEAGKQLMQRRMPDNDRDAFAGDVSVKDLRRYFMKINTWVRMIQSLMEHTPNQCAACCGTLLVSSAQRLKCAQCAAETSMRSGEEVNRQWVVEYYEKEYRCANQELAEAHNSGQ
jgi:acyl carrier protein